MAIATHFPDEFAAIAESLRPSTVQVRSYQRASSGSGVIWHSDGLIITNDHVVNEPQMTIELADGRVLDATVTARDSKRDLAALKVDATDLPSATIRTSEELRVGELVLAMGNPLGLVGALSVGIIHASPHPSYEPSNQPEVQFHRFNHRWNRFKFNQFEHHPLKYHSWIQADIRLAPGNSGGPLADAQGHVIGINSMIVEGLGLAIPSDAVEHFLNFPQSERPYLGITFQPVPVSLGRRRFHGWRGFACGLLITEVVPNSTAEVAGLLMGDVLIGSDQLFSHPDDLGEILGQAGLGDRLTLSFIRGGVPMRCEVVLRSQNAGVQAA